jgi:hypothetical protein
VTDARLDLSAVDTGAGSNHLAISIDNTVHKFFAATKELAQQTVDAVLRGVAYAQKTTEGPSVNSDYEMPIVDFTDDPEQPPVMKLAKENVLSICSLGSEEDEDDFMSTSSGNTDETACHVNFSSFTIIEELGSGSFGKVYKVFKNDTREIFAMKALSKQNLIKQEQLKYAIGECRILRSIDSKFIIKLHYAF